MNVNRYPWYLSAMARGEKKSKLVAVRLEPDVLAAIEREADKEDRPLAAMTRILIKEALSSREEKPPKKKPA